MAFDAEKTGDDDALLALYAGGDRAAPRLMTDRFLPHTYRLALRFLGDRTEAEDVAQEAMVRLFRMAPGWQPGQAKVTTWLYRVTANLCTDRLRRRPAVNIDEVPEMSDGAPSAEERLTDGARLTALDLALARLPERQRVAVVLRHIEGLANPEIAAVLEVGVEAVESLIARGKRALKEELGGMRAALGYDHD